jgi:RNA polymerase sigma factor (sigma-70 family)
MPATDSDLLDAFRREGTEHSFLALYDRHAPAMYALALRLMGGHEADAADALQDAWLRVLPRVAQFRAESSLRTWLCGFVVNCCRERFRGRLFEEVVDEGELPRARRRTEGTESTGIDLERALAQLPPGARAIVILHDIEGYTHREIAAALGIDDGTSKSQLSRGRAALRRRLAPRAIEMRRQ